MPDWAVDKHTFRGKHGKGTMHILKKNKIKLELSDQAMHKFHGPREKRDIKDFFREAVFVAKNMVENPDYKKVLAIYLSHTKCY